jgi:hypothetical protein
MESYIKSSPWGASLPLPRSARERDVAPLSAAQGTGVPATGPSGVYGGFGFQPAGQHASTSAITGTPVMTVDAPFGNTDVDVRVPPRGRPL